MTRTRHRSKSTTVIITLLVIGVIIIGAALFTSTRASTDARRRCASIDMSAIRIDDRTGWVCVRTEPLP